MATANEGLISGLTQRKQAFATLGRNKIISYRLNSQRKIKIYRYGELSESIFQILKVKLQVHGASSRLVGGDVLCP